MHPAAAIALSIAAAALRFADQAHPVVLVAAAFLVNCVLQTFTRTDEFRRAARLLSASFMLLYAVHWYPQVDIESDITGSLLALVRILAAGVLFHATIATPLVAAHQSLRRRSEQMRVDAKRRRETRLAQREEKRRIREAAKVTRPQPPSREEILKKQADEAAKAYDLEMQMIETSRLGVFERKWA